MALLGPSYELCCFSHKGRKIPILGNFPSNGRIELNSMYTISVRREDYDTLRGLVENNGEHGILNSDRRIDTQSPAMLSFAVDGSEYAHLASWGERCTKKTKSESSPLLIGENQTVSPDVIGKKSKYQARYRQPTASELIEQTISGYVENNGRHSLRNIRKRITHAVISGAKELGQRPGRVLPTKKGGIKLDERATKQFETVYPYFL